MYEGLKICEGALWKKRDQLEELLNWGHKQILGGKGSCLCGMEAV